MLSLDDIVAAAAGDERDALRRAMAEDLETAAARRGGPGFVGASTPADLARALGRERRARLSTGTPRRGDPGRRQA
ncbi:hypothetical protein SAMN02799631_03183 [Methylobacterium sp. 174MFSha1.1]|nr:hypothetical protein SAMN02799631_03183 [Methylobacterium sp. 174MFSha1.1]